MEKKDGRLGIINLSMLIQALLEKWCWRFVDIMETSDCREIWRGRGRMVFSCLKGRLWSGIWKAIRNGLMEFSKREAFKVGNTSLRVGGLH